MVWKHNDNASAPSPASICRNVAAILFKVQPAQKRPRRGGAVGRVTQGIWVENMCVCVGVRTLVWWRVAHQKSVVCLWRQLSCPHPSAIAAFLLLSQDISSPLLSITAPSSLHPPLQHARLPSTSTSTSATQPHFFSSMRVYLSSLASPFPPTQHNTTAHEQQTPAASRLISLQVQEKRAENIKVPILFSCFLAPPAWLMSSVAVSFL